MYVHSKLNFKLNYIIINFTEEEELDAAFKILEPVAQTFLDPKRVEKSNIRTDIAEANFLKFFCGGDVSSNIDYSLYAYF